MATPSIASSRLIENPFLGASPTRYSTSDVGAAAILNSTPAWFSDFVPFVAIDSDRYEVRGHDPASGGRNAEFYLNNGVTNIAAETPYVLDDPLDSQVSVEVPLKQLSARYDDRDFARYVQSDEYSQMQFQKDAMAQAIWAQFERCAMQGNAGANPQEFDGLGQLVINGYGQATAAVDNTFNDWNRAMQLLRSRNRRVTMIVTNTDGFNRAEHLSRVTGGYELPAKAAGRSGMMVSLYRGIPIVISDHIITDSQNDTAPVFFLTPEVFAVVHRLCPTVKFIGGHREDSPFESVQAIWFAALVSTTNHALAQLTNWSTLLA